MKKIISVLACLVLVFAMTTVVMAENSVTVTADKDAVRVGETVELLVSVADAPIATTIGIEFDAGSCFAFESGEWLLQDQMFKDDPTALGTAGIVYSNETDLNGDIIKLVFKAIDEAEEPQEISIAVQYVNSASAAVLTETAKKAVTAYKPAITGVKFAKDVYEYTYDGTEKTVEVTGLGKGMTVEYDGTNVATDAGEYEVTALVTKEGHKDLELSTTIVINPKAVTIEGLTAQDKVYDTTTEAVITGGELKGVIGDDAVEANIPEIGTFESANVGTRIAVAYEEIVLSGDDAENYVLKEQPALTAKITACPVTITTKTLVKAGKLEGQDDPEDNYGYSIEPAWADEYIDVVVARKAGEAKGEYPINAEVSNNSNFKVTVVKGIFSIDDKYTQQVVVPTIGELVYGGDDVSVAVEPDLESGITVFDYVSSNEDVVIVDAAGTVSIIGVGSAKITITSEGNDEYKPLNKTVDIVVVPQTISEIVDIYFNDDGVLVIVLEDETEIEVDLSGADIEINEDDEVTLSGIGIFDANYVLDDEIVIPTFVAPAEQLIFVESEETENGFIEGTGKYLIGSTVTITPKANSGYKVKSVTVTDTAEGTEIVTAKTEDGEYTFTATVDATVTAEFAKKSGSIILPAPGSDKKPGTGTIANKTASQIILTIGSVDAQVFGAPVSNDVAPIIENDRTMLPARFVAESLGAYVAWDNAQRKVTIHKNLTMIEIYIDSDIAYINGNPVTLDSPAFIRNDRTYTPVRFIAEALGATVEWNELLRQVIITRN